MAKIHGLATECLGLFRVGAEKVSAASDELSQTALLNSFKDPQGRFKIWCDNLGVLQRSHASLDWRLRDSGTTQSGILNLLGFVQDDLTNCAVP